MKTVDCNEERTFRISTDAEDKQNAQPLLVSKKMSRASSAAIKPFQARLLFLFCGVPVFECYPIWRYLRVKVNYRRGLGSSITPHHGDYPVLFVLEQCACFKETIKGRAPSTRTNLNCAELESEFSWRRNRFNPQGRILTTPNRR